MSDIIDYVVAVGVLCTLVWAMNTDENYDRFEGAKSPTWQSVFKNHKEQPANPEARLGDAPVSARAAQ